MSNLSQEELKECRDRINPLESTRNYSKVGTKDDFASNNKNKKRHDDLDFDAELKRIDMECNSYE